MEAIILAGGLGTRLRSVVPDRPKVMALVNKKPFLSFLLKSLENKNFNHIVLSVGYLSHQIYDYFGNNFKNLKIDYVFEKTPLGTGGAIRLALTKCHEDHVYVFNGDTYLDLEVKEIEKYWHLHKKILIVVKQVKNTKRYGRIIIQNNKIINFLEGKNGSGLINAGCYVLSRNTLNNFQINKRFSFEKSFLRNQAKLKNLTFFETKNKFIDIGIPKDYKKANKELRNECQ